jgi:class 3 adenylate cyclase
MSAFDGGSLKPLGDGDFSQEIGLVDMGHDLLTPTSTVIAYTEMLLEYADEHIKDPEFISDINKVLIAGEQLSTLITQLFSQKDSFQGGVDLESLTSSFRHDLRTPINAILGYGEMLLEDIDQDAHPEACVDLQKILTTARRLLTLINDLSYFSRNSGSTTSKSKNIDRDNEEVPRSNSASNEVSDVHTSTQEKANDTVLPSWNKYEKNNTFPIDIDSQQAFLLLVDDKEANRDLLSRRLYKEGFRVELAENGRQALQMLRNMDFDLVLLDIIMPEMDGYQVLGEIKRDEQLCRMPVIMISALDEIDSVVRCIEMGAEDYLQKPFNQVILNAKISATLERKRLRDRERDFLKKLQEEQEKSEKLLLNILPQPIAERLKKGEATIADSYSEVTVFFSDLVGFTELSTGISASALVEKLNRIFIAFDKLTEKYGLEKIKTIGDAYMLVGGAPTPRPDHAEAVAYLALDVLKTLENLNEENNENFRVRIGMHTGPIVAGVMGKHKFNYDLWGDTVNIASRMESQGIPDHIQISESTYQLLKDKFVCELRGPIDIKGKGKMVTYILQGKK